MWRLCLYPLVWSLCLHPLHQWSDPLHPQLWAPWIHSLHLDPLHLEHVPNALVEVGAVLPPAAKSAPMEYVVHHCPCCLLPLCGLLGLLPLCGLLPLLGAKAVVVEGDWALA